MWKVNGENLIMTEGDYGLILPVTINGITFAEYDKLKFTFKGSPNGTTILEKEYTDVADNSAEFELTAAESALFKPGNYVYTLDWYQENNFMCNIIQNGVFKVVDKA